MCGALSYALALELSHQPVSTRSPRPHILSSLVFFPPRHHNIHTTTTIALQTSNPSYYFCDVCPTSTTTTTTLQEPLLRMTIRSPDGALSRYLLPNGFPPNRLALIYAFPLQLTTTTSCFDSIMYFFPTVSCFLSSPPLQPTTDSKKDATGCLHRFYHPGTGQSHGHFSSVTPGPDVPMNSLTRIRNT